MNNRMVSSPAKDKKECPEEEEKRARRKAWFGIYLPTLH